MATTTEAASAELFRLLLISIDFTPTCTRISPGSLNTIVPYTKIDTLKYIETFIKKNALQYVIDLKIVLKNTHMQGCRSLGQQHDRRLTCKCVC
jgi:hypothetical protein